MSTLRLTAIDDNKTPGAAANKAASAIIGHHRVGAKETLCVAARSSVCGAGSDSLAPWCWNVWFQHGAGPGGRDDRASFSSPSLAGSSPAGCMTPVALAHPARAREMARRPSGAARVGASGLPGFFFFGDHSRNRYTPDLHPPHAYDWRTTTAGFQGFLPRSQ